jgi:hypothetical protein
MGVLFEKGKPGGETFNLLPLNISIFMNPLVRHSRWDTTGLVFGFHITDDLLEFWFVSDAFKKRTIFDLGDPKGRHCLSLFKNPQILKRFLFISSKCIYLYEIIIKP